MTNNEHSKSIVPIPIQPYKTEELARIYGVSAKTFNNWLEPFKSELGEKRGWYYNVIQVKLIFEKLGKPERDK